MEQQMKSDSGRGLEEKELIFLAKRDYVTFG